MAEDSKLKPGPRQQKKSMKKAQTDVIDKLDLTGLYGLGGGGFHHSGPYDAATSRQNVNSNTGKRRTLAPIAAFHPSALDPAIGHRQSRAYPAMPNSAGTLRTQPKSNGVGVSARAQAAMSAMNEAGGIGASPYPVLKHAASEGSLLEPLLAGSTSSVNRSTSSVAMGFPVSQGVSQKDVQVMQVWGIRENEAWEDYGRAYDPANSSKLDKSTSRLTMGSGLTKEERAVRAASVWDMEATLREGKPVASTAPPVPPIPEMPDISQFSDVPTGHRRGRSKTLNSSDQIDGPKRSKSLIHRLRKASKNPNIPMGSDSDTPKSPLTSPRVVKQSLEVPEKQHLTVSMPTTPIGSDGKLSESPVNDEYLDPAMSQMRGKLSSPSTPDFCEKSHSTGPIPPVPAQDLGRKGSLMQRVRSFRKRKE